MRDALGHLGIPVIHQFTAEGIDCAQDLAHRPEVLERAYAFGRRVAAVAMGIWEG